MKTFPFVSGSSQKCLLCVGHILQRTSGAQFENIERLNSSHSHSVPDPLYFTSLLGKIPSSLSCCSPGGPYCFPVTTCCHLEGLVPSCLLDASSCLPLTLVQMLRPGRSVPAAGGGGGGQLHPLVWGFLVSMVNIAHRHLVWVDLFPWAVWGKFKNYATAFIFPKFCTIIWHNDFKFRSPVIFSSPKQSPICPLIRTPGSDGTFWVSSV